jgi:tetratricopeptide (TPR) repeat protein
MRRVALLLWAAALFCAFPAAGAESPAALYNAGNAAYGKGDFAGAIENYRAALGQGASSADLYYNLGNACLKAGRLGPAVAAYERALRLAPRDPDLAHNLRFARVQIKGKLPQVERGFWLQTWDQARDSFSLNELLTLLSVGWLLLGLGLAGRIFFRPAAPRIAASATLGVGLALLVLFAPLTLAKLKQEVWNSRAVVQAERTPARSGPGPQNAELFELFEGMEVNVKQCESGYCEVRVPGGLMGWIQAGTFEII